MVLEGSRFKIKTCFHDFTLRVTANQGALQNLEDEDDEDLELDFMARRNPIKSKKSKFEQEITSDGESNKSGDEEDDDSEKDSDDSGDEDDSSADNSDYDVHEHFNQKTGNGKVANGAPAPGGEKGMQSKRNCFSQRNSAFFFLLSEG